MISLINQIAIDLYSNFKRKRNNENESAQCVSEPRRNISSDNGIIFRVYRANGGTVIETNFFNYKTDRNYTSLYVIPNDKDLGQEINKIITMESLKE